MKYLYSKSALYLALTIQFGAPLIANAQHSAGTEALLKTTEIRIRDPYILVDNKSQTYYMYAQIQNRLNDPDGPQGVEVYTSKDLENWTPPRAVLTLADDFWARKSVWAPEVHHYKGAYYLFVTLTSTGKLRASPNPQNGAIQWKRGTHVYKADSPLGPFIPFQNEAHTPAAWMSLDGTLWEEDGKPYMAFCHEWAQTFDGTIEVVELAPDLSKPIGEPTLLFKASAAKWVRNMQEVGLKQNGLVTDGTFFYQNKGGELIMTWSSFGDHQYAIGQAVSASGSLFGPWEQIDEPLVKANGGHGMIFHTLAGQMMLAFHQPNSRGKERLHLREIQENEQGLLEIEDPAKEKGDQLAKVILPGNYPDPSILRAGNTYYLTQNTDDFAPGLSIWSSTDMQNWTRLTNVLTKHIGAVWASDLVEHQGKFYIYFTVKTPTEGLKNFVVRADHIEGPWSEPLALELSEKGIDPGHIATPDGRRFIMLSRGYLYELDASGTKVISEGKKVYDGWPIPEDWAIECFCAESPKLLYRNGYYYLLTAQGGTAGPATSHMVVAARSKSLEGPWENSPYNPVIHTWDKSEKWWSKGHGTLIEDSVGKWWMVYHAYEKGFLSRGRQVLASPMEWTEDGWFKLGESTSLRDRQGQSWRDEFDAENLELRWAFMSRDAGGEAYAIKDGQLRLKGVRDKLSDKNVLATIPENRSYQIQTKLSITPSTTGGLVLYYDDKHHAAVALNEDGVFQITKGVKRGKTATNNQSVWLKLVHDEQEISFYFSEDGQAWEKFDFGMEISGFNHNTLGRFRSVKIGLFAYGEGEAVFDYFEYQAEETMDMEGSAVPPVGWTALFNGQNLDGWTMSTRNTHFSGTKAEIFKVENGIIHTYPTQEHLSEQPFAGLITENTYSDFKLSLEYKWGTKKFKPRHEFVRDAGIIFHVHGKDEIWPNGVECQIQEGDTGDLWAIGAKVTSKVQKVIRNYSPTGELMTLGKPEQRFHRFHRGYSWEVPGWNRLDIEVKGDHAIFKVNGNIVNEAIDMKYWDEEAQAYKPLTAGKILIQAEGAELFYRNIFIQEN